MVVAIESLWDFLLILLIGEGNVRNKQGDINSQTRKKIEKKMLKLMWQNVEKGGMVGGKDPPLLLGHASILHTS